MPLCHYASMPLWSYAPQNARFHAPMPPIHAAMPQIRQHGAIAPWYLPCRAQPHCLPVWSPPESLKWTLFGTLFLNSIFELYLGSSLCTSPNSDQILPNACTYRYAHDWTTDGCHRKTCPEEGTVTWLYSPGSPSRDLPIPHFSWFFPFYSMRYKSSPFPPHAAKKSLRQLLKRSRWLSALERGLWHPSTVVETISYLIGRTALFLAHFRPF